MGNPLSIGTVLYDEPVEIPSAQDQIHAISSVNLKRSFVINPKQEYTIELICSNDCYLYYGSGGKSPIISDNRFEFIFKYTTGSAQDHALSPVISLYSTFTPK